MIEFLQLEVDEENNSLTQLSGEEEQVTDMESHSHSNNNIIESIKSLNQFDIINNNNIATSTNNDDESKEIRSPISLHQMNPANRRKTVATTILKDQPKSAKLEEFEPSFLASINTRMELFFNDRIRTAIRHDYKNLNMFNFNFEKMKYYKKYYPEFNFDNTMKNSQLFKKVGKENKRKLKKACELTGIYNNTI